MEDTIIPVVQGGGTNTEIIQQFLAFAEAQGGALALQAADAKARLRDRDLIDQLIWIFKVNAPKGYDLDSTTGASLKLNYSWIPQILDH